MRLLCLVVLSLVGCGGSTSSLYTAPKSHFATMPVEKAPGTVCFESTQPYDQEFGCLGWRGGVAFEVVHRNTLGKSFRWVGAAYAIDGVMALDTNEPALVGRDTVTIATAELTPGKHELAVELVYAGEGHGVFSYLRGYRFQVRGHHAFGIKPGQPLSIVVVGGEEGGPATPLEERPKVRFMELPLQ